MSPGPLTTTRALVAHELVDAAAPRGLAIHLVEAASSEQEIQGLEDGTIDLALVSGAYEADWQARVREVAPLYVEALHLLVKQEIAPAIGGGLEIGRAHV